MFQWFQPIIDWFSLSSEYIPFLLFLILIVLIISLIRG